jgi:hypothetical protein
MEIQRQSIASDVSQFVKARHDLELQKFDDILGLNCADFVRLIEN